jgi:hypothetical protein
MTPIENKERHKYKTKKIKMNWIEFFLKTTNQKSAKIISSRNFSDIATRLWKVWLSGSLVWPLKNIRMVIRAITEKVTDKIKISPVWNMSPSDLSAIKPASKNSTLIIIRTRIILIISFRAEFTL